MNNIIRSQWQVPSGGVLYVTLVTPEPVTPEQVEKFGCLVEAVERTLYDGTADHLVRRT